MDFESLSKKVWNIIIEDQKNKIDQEETHNKIDKILKESCPDKVYKNLMYRKDDRNFAKFFLDIKKGTDNELETLKRWEKDLMGRGVSMSYQNNGIDNSGLPVIYDAKLGKPDFSIEIKSKNNRAKFLVDIKNNPKTDKYMTFKVDDLKRYLDKGSFVYVAMEKSWVLFGPKFIKGLLSDWPREIFYKFAPNKESIRIHKKYFIFLRDKNKLSCYNWNDKKRFYLIDIETSYKKVNDLINKEEKKEK